MRKQKQSDYIQPDLQSEDLVRQLIKARPKKKAHRGPKKILRTETYRGHNIKIETTYKITVDGKAVDGHFDITNSGHVHYHPLPNRSASSAIEMVCAIIDSFPDDFPSPKKYKSKASKRKKTPAKKTRTKSGKKASTRASGSYTTRRKGGK